MNIRLHPEAEREFREATVWYDHQRMGLALSSFYASTKLSSGFDAIPRCTPKYIITPDGSSSNDFHLPFFYEIGENEIRVLAIFHSRRKPFSLAIT
jgi:hypothetical protein